MSRDVRPSGASSGGGNAPYVRPPSLWKDAFIRDAHTEGKIYMLLFIYIESYQKMLRIDINKDMYLEMMWIIMHRRVNLCSRSRIGWD